MSFLRTLLRRGLLSLPSYFRTPFLDERYGNHARAPEFAAASCDESSSKHQHMEHDGYDYVVSDAEHVYSATRNPP
jgi:hypothetical protein